MSEDPKQDPDMPDEDDQTQLSKGSEVMDELVEDQNADGPEPEPEPG